MLKILSLPLALFAYTLLSIGLVLMKKGIDWIGYKGPKERIYWNNLFTWLAGFLLINICIIPNTLSLKHLDPHIVTAMAGWGVIVMVFLSSVVLKERIFPSDYLNTGIIVSAIVLLNLFEQKEAVDHMQTSSYLVLSIFPFLLLVPAFMKSLSKKSRSILFAAVAGISIGMIVVTMNILVMKYGFHIPSFFSSVFLYIYLLFSLLAFLALQFSYKTGFMMTVGSVQYSLGIIYPVICAHFVFDHQLHWIQVLSFLILAYGVFAILKKR